MKHTKSIVCIGGGTGTFVVLKGLKQYPYLLNAIVSMSDSGGSNKRIRDEFGLLPTSDIRQCLVALSEENGGAGLLRKLFMYRFEKGQGLQGMTFGNLFMAALSDILGSQAKAIQQTGKVLRIHGNVLPVSYTDTNLYATYEDGSVVKEEHLIDEPKHDGTLRISSIVLNPNAYANPDAVQAIEKAQLIVIGPGDVYTSILPNMLVQGIPEAIQQSKAQKVYIVNLMTKYGQTYKYTACDHVRAIEQYIGCRLDTVIINNAPIPQKALNAYALQGEHPVIDDLSSLVTTNIIHADLVNPHILIKSQNDSLVRSLIRHDSMKIARELVKLI